MVAKDSFTAAVRDLGQGHLARIEDILFSSIGFGSQVPSWLDETARQLVERYSGVHTTAEFEATLRGFENRKNEPFEIFIIGEGKFGKSTLLNALMGKELSKVHRHPMTRSFLRFVPSAAPSNWARLFVRLNPEKHQWLLSELEPGREVPELYQITEHKVLVEKGEKLLNEELERCRRDKTYEAAIYEYECEIPINSRSVFPPNVRLVDTQGLNQIFPDDLVKSFISNATTTVERFEQWLATTPRGRHIEWQFRRCDAVLWLLSALDSTSSITRSAMSYFRKYGKKTILVVTKIDMVDGGVSGRNKVLNKIQNTFGEHVDQMIPINAEMAFRSVINNDLALAVESGCEILTNAISKECIGPSVKVRATGMYNALRRTEQQLRHALRTLVAEIDIVLRQLIDHRERVLRAKKKAKAAISSGIDAKGNALKLHFSSNVRMIDLKDDEYSAEAKIRPAEISKILENDASNMLSLIAEECRILSDQLSKEPYRLPWFDAEGQRGGDLIKVRPSASIPLPTFQWPSFRLHLQKMPFFKRIWTWITGQKQTEINKRQESVLSQSMEQWKIFIQAIQTQSNEYVEKTYVSLQKELNSVEKQLEGAEGKPLEVSLEIIKRSLNDISVRPLPAGMLVDVFRRREKVLPLISMLTRG